MFFYQLRDLQLAALAPWHLAALAMQNAVCGPFSLFSETPWGRGLSSGLSMFERASRPYAKPLFGIKETKFRGESIEVGEEALLRSPFCRLVHFTRESENISILEHAQADPRLLIVAPLSGHFATLLRGTVEAMLPSHNVYITDWADAKMVPLLAGNFDLEDQIEELIRILRFLGPSLHVLSVGEAGFPTLCALSLLAAADDPMEVLSLTLLGGPIDQACAVSPLSELALSHPMSWFQETKIDLVPPYYPGAFRAVYPGFVQLQDRMSLPLDGGIVEQIKHFEHLTRGDEETPQAHERLYDEFTSVMDVPAEYYLQYTEKVYQQNALASGSLTWRGRRVDPAALRRTALLAVEGDMDDLAPPGQTRAALALCSGVPAEAKQAHLEIDVGTYGLFSGRKWRNNIQPVVHKFIRLHALAASDSGGAVNA